MCFKPGSDIVNDRAHVVVDCLAVGQALGGGIDERVILFIKLQEGCICTNELQKLIKAEIRSRRSARHVPERVSNALIVWLLQYKCK